MSDDKKTLYIGIAAAGVLLSAAALWYSYREDGDKQATDMLKKLTEAELTDVKKKESGQLDTQYFLNLLQFVGLETRARTSGLRKQCHKERRKHYNTKDWAAYRKVVKKIVDGEDEMAQTVVKEIIPLINVTLEEFHVTHDQLAGNPQTAEFVMAA